MIYAETNHLSTIVFNIGEVITKSLLESFNLFIQLALAEIIRTHKKDIQFNIINAKNLNFETILKKEEKIKSVLFMKNLTKAMILKLSNSTELNDLNFKFISQVRYKNKYFLENLKLTEKLLPGEIIYKI
jgi:hypothetical protein